MRRFHSIAGLGGALVVVFMALTGAILSLQPAVETAAARAWNGLANVAELADAVASALPSVERITRAASGMVVAYYSENGVHHAVQVDPGTGQVIGPYEPAALFSFVTELHRSLFMGDAGACRGRRRIRRHRHRRGKRDLPAGRPHGRLEAPVLAGEG